MFDNIYYKGQVLDAIVYKNNYIRPFRELKPTEDSLFSKGDVGFWYDPNDLTTMYKDSSAASPVTGVDQPVGLILDKSRGLASGVELFTQFDLEVSSTLSQNILPTIITNTESSNEFGAGASGLIKGKAYKIEFSWSGNTARSGIIVEAANMSVLISSAESGSISRVIYPTSWGYFYIKATFPTVGQTLTINTLSIKEVPGNHAFQSTSASRPILRQNVITKAYYLEFDGVDDFLRTNNIDFTATSKMSLFAGLQKVSDSATGIVVELSNNLNNNPGTFYLSAPFNADSPNSALVVKMTTPVILNLANLQSPVSFVATGLLDISDQLNRLNKFRVNGLLHQSTSDTGIGNFGNYPLYIGRRSGASSPFNGHLYNLIGVGRLTTETETPLLEKEIAKKIGVTLNV